MTQSSETTRRTNGAMQGDGFTAQPAARFGSRVFSKFIGLLSKCLSVFNRMTRPFCNETYYLDSFNRFPSFLLWSDSRIDVPSVFGFFGGFFFLSFIKGSPNGR